MIDRVVNLDGKESAQTTDILEAIKQYYTNLCKDEDVSTGDASLLLADLPRIDPCNVETVGANITQQELLLYNYYIITIHL